MHPHLSHLLNEARSRVNIVPAQKAQDILAQGALALDVRESNEFDAGQLPGAIHIARGLLEFMTPNHPQLQDQTQPLLVYCKNGGRSTLAAALLMDMGFNNV